MDKYLKDSVFLPYMNNEEGATMTLATQKDRFSSLNGLLLMMFEQDSMVYPKESEWF
jgi:palmitoyl-protein thioesterase